MILPILYPQTLRLLFQMIARKPMMTITPTLYQQPAWYYLYWDFAYLPGLLYMLCKQAVMDKTANQR